MEFGRKPFRMRRCAHAPKPEEPELKPARVAAAAAALFLTLQAQAQTKNPVVANVNDDKLYRSDIDDARAQLPERYRHLPLQEVYQPLLTRLIRAKLFAQQARAEGLHKSALYKRRLAVLADRLLGEMLLEREFAARIDEKTLRSRYEKTVERTGEEIRARHILVRSQAEAAEIIERLTAGADFSKLAADKSIGPSKDKGGDLGYFGRGQMVPSFEAAAFALGKNETTKKPVQSPFGWHVIKLEDRRRPKPPSFEEARGKLFEDMSREVAEDLVRRLTESARIERYQPDGSAPSLRPAPSGG